MAQDLLENTGMKHRLLVVDDERAILMAVGEYFRRRGYEVACTRQREEAEALLVQEHYACVIADLRLTAQGTDDGLAIAAFVRERCPETRVVILTAYGSPAAEKEARLRGVDAFIHKPKPLAEVARVIEQLVGDVP
jgi:ActR/RegA family two-component response regulator